MNTVPPTPEPGPGQLDPAVSRLPIRVSEACEFCDEQYKAAAADRASADRALDKQRDLHLADQHPEAYARAHGLPLPTDLEGPRP